MKCTRPALHSNDFASPRTFAISVQISQVHSDQARNVFVLHQFVKSFLIFSISPKVVLTISTKEKLESQLKKFIIRYFLTHCAVKLSSVVQSLQ